MADDLLAGLERMSSRGDEATGIAFLSGSGFVRVRADGPAPLLRNRLSGLDLLMAKTTVGLAHTRWSTHGGTGDVCAHPHLDCTKRIAVAHNGIIENQALLRHALKGHHPMESGTDSELLAHLLEKELADACRGRDAVEAVVRVLRRLEGPYAVCFADASTTTLYAASNLVPLVVGVSPTHQAVASDADALPARMLVGAYLQSDVVAVLQPSGLSLHGFDGGHKPLQLASLPHSEGFPKPSQGWMKSEMEAQPTALHEMMGRRQEFAALVRTVREWLSREPADVRLIGCGSSYNACLSGRRALLRAGMAAEVRRPLEAGPEADDGRRRLHLVVSQSGETLDLLRHTQALLDGDVPDDRMVVGLVNGGRTTLARMLAGHGRTPTAIFDLRIGAEHGVVATKSYTAQVLALAQMAAELGGSSLPSALPSPATDLTPSMRHLVTVLQSCQVAMSVAGPDEESAGREAALKLKELARCMVEFVPLDDLKHGPLALASPDIPAIIFLPLEGDRRVRSCAETAIHLLASRGSPVWVVCDEMQAKSIEGLPWQDLIICPNTGRALRPIAQVLPFQAIAHAVSCARGWDPDRPRNLAKAVTV